MAATILAGGLIVAAVTPSGAAPRAGAGSRRVPVPDLPPRHVLEPDLYDKNDCQLAPESDATNARWRAYCGPDDDDSTQPVGARAWRNLLGFVGPQFPDFVANDGVVLVSGSVTTASEGPWRAWGLARNESTRTARAEVTASLLDDNGDLIGTAAADLAVDALHPGEPGPFALTSDVDAAKVAQVEWSVTSAAAGGSPREFLIRQHWTLAYGARERADSYYTDPEGPGPYPYVLAGDAVNLGAGATPVPDIVAAWLDEEGRVRWVDTARSGEVPFNKAKAATMPGRIGPHRVGPFFLTVDDPSAAPALDGLTPMLWAVGR